MIHYSSIKDAWGKKDMFKNNIPLGKFTNIYDSATNCKVQTQAPAHTHTPNVQPTSPPETFTQKETIKYDVQNVAHHIEQPVAQPIEQFTQNNCAFIEHLQNCPFCMGKMKEHFAETSSSTSNAPLEQPISIINLFGFKINITKDVLRILFVIILIVIFILLLRMVNVSFKKDNTSNADLLRLMTQMKYLNLV